MSERPGYRVERRATRVVDGGPAPVAGRAVGKYRQL